MVITGRDFFCGVLPAIIGAGIIALGTCADVRAQSAPAVDTPIIQRSDAVVTGFSGVKALRPQPNAAPGDNLFIDASGAALQILDLGAMLGADDGRLVRVRREHVVPAEKIGQVFGVVLDDGLPVDGSEDGVDHAPNIYATATSVFGLRLVESRQQGNQTIDFRVTKGSASAKWMAGQFGTDPDAGPGSIWKVDGRTGEATLFANVVFEGAGNSGPGLGAITFDPKSRVLFVSDLQTGMIHGFDLTGREVSQFDHGVNGRVRRGLQAVAFDPSKRRDITSTDFDTEDSASWGLAAPERQVWGLAVRNGRLFYASSDGPDIWSVAISDTGQFGDDARLETRVVSDSGDPVTAIAFARDGTMYLSQRGKQLASYDFKVLATPNTAQVLRYKLIKRANGTVIWQPVPDEYAIGHAASYRNTNGGVALGYGHDERGYIRYSKCESTLWTTGEILRAGMEGADPDAVHGLQGNRVELVRPQNEPPQNTYFVDYDGLIDHPDYRGHMGQIATWGCSGSEKLAGAATSGSTERGAGTPGTGTPGTADSIPPGLGPPEITIAKSCQDGSLGGTIECSVTITNAGTQTPTGTVGFDDLATVLKGPFPGSGVVIIDAIPDQQGWACSPLPATSLSCNIDGSLMPPGTQRSVDVVMDVSALSAAVGYQVRNCATVSGTANTICATSGNELVVAKSGPSVCQAGASCTFEISVNNLGSGTFDSDVVFADRISIPGAQPASIVWIAPKIATCDPINLPFQCAVPLTLGPGASRTYEITVDIPVSAGQSGPGATARNCFFAASPSVVAASNQGFSALANNALIPSQPATGPGYGCWDFTITPPDPTNTPVNPTTNQPPSNSGTTANCNTPLTTLQLTPAPASFKNAGDVIDVQIDVTNSSTKDAISTWAVTSPDMTLVGCQPASGPIGKQGSVQCQAKYIVTQADMSGGAIVVGAKVEGQSACGQIPTNSTAIEIPGETPTGLPGTKPGTTPSTTPSSSTGRTTNTSTSSDPNNTDVTVSVSTSPPTITTTGQPVTITTTISNGGKVPITVTSTIDINGNPVTVPSTSVNPGKSVETSINGKTTVDEIKTGINTTVIVTGKDANGNPIIIPPTTASTPFISTPDVHVSVTPSVTEFTKAGEPVSYTYTVTNSGNVPITSYTLKDDKVTKITCKPADSAVPGVAIEAGASVTCTGTYTTTTADLGRAIYNYAQVTATTVLGTLPASSCAGVVAFNGNPAMELQASCNPSTYKRAGQEIACTFVVANTGNVPLGSCFVYGERIKVPCPVGTIAPGGRTEFQGSYVSTAADVGKDIGMDFRLTGDSNQ